MRFVILALILAAGPLAAMAQETEQKYKELAGTVILGERMLPVLKSGGLDYLLMVQPQEPGAQALKSGMAVIVKGLVQSAEEPGQPVRLLLRPYEVTIRGQTIPFKRLPDGVISPWD